MNPPEYSSQRNAYASSRTTIGIDMAKPESFLKDTSIIVWDFAGQPQYITTHQVMNSFSKLFNYEAFSWICQHSILSCCGCQQLNARD